MKTRIFTIILCLAMASTAFAEDTLIEKTYSVLRDNPELTESLLVSFVLTTWDENFDQPQPKIMDPLCMCEFLPEENAIRVTQTPEVIRHLDAFYAMLVTGKSPEPSAGTQKILAALDSPATMDYRKTPLAEVAKDLAARHGISVRVDTATVTSPQPFTLRVRDISLRNALRCLFHGTELDFMITDDTLLFTTRETADAVLEPRLHPWKFWVYEGIPLDDMDKIFAHSELISRGEAVPESEYETCIADDDIIHLIKCTVARDEWCDNGIGKSDIIALPGEAPNVGDGHLVVFASQRTHAQVAELLEQVRHLLLPEEYADKAMTDEELVTVLATRRPVKSPGELRLETALDTMMSLDVPKGAITAGQLAAYVGKTLREKGVPVNVLVDWQALEEEYHLDAGDPIPIMPGLRNLSLRTLLPMVSADCNIRLDFMLMHDCLWITSTEAAHDHIYVRTYPVNLHISEFVLIDEQSREVFGDEEGATYLDYESIIDNITIFCDTDSWREGSGPGPVAPWPMNCCVDVRECYDYHREVEAFLSLYNNWPTTEPEADRRLREVLAAKVTLEYAGKSLEEVAHDLGEKYQTTVRLGAIYDDLDEDVEKMSITFAAADVPLAEALAQMLSPRGLEAVAYPGGVLRIQPENCDSPRVLRFYPWDFSVHDEDAVTAAMCTLDPSIEDRAFERMTVGFLGDTVIIFASEKTQRTVREILEGMKK